jgi:hypothetical protein
LENGQGEGIITVYRISAIFFELWRRWIAISSSILFSVNFCVLGVLPLFFFSIAVFQLHKEEQSWFFVVGVGITHHPEQSFLFQRGGFTIPIEGNQRFQPRV